MLTKILWEKELHYFLTFQTSVNVTATLSVLDELNYHLTLLKMWNPAFLTGRATCVYVLRHDTDCIHCCCYHFSYDSAADLPWNVSATSNRLFPSAALSPPSKNSGVSSLSVMAILFPAMCCRWMPCFHTLRASPLTTIKDRLVRGTCTSTSGSESLVKDSTESDSRFKVTSRSPQSQKSSKCGSMAAPLSDMYSRLHSSTGWKSDSCSRPCILS